MLRRCVLPWLVIPTLLTSEESITPESLRVQVDALAKAERTVWSSCDIDHDGRPSRFEVIAGLAGDPAWFKRHLPESWKAVDANGDGAASVAELTTLAARDPDKAFSIAEHRKSVRQQLNLGQDMAPGTSVGVGGNRAYVYFGNQQAYIADYDIVNGQYDPVIGVLGSGTVLDVADVRITVVRKRP